MLYRGEALARPGPEVRRVALWQEDLLEDYRALGLATVIDLRAESEAVLAPSVWHEATHARLVPIPFDEGGEGDATEYMRQLRAGTLRSFSAEDLAAFYERTARARAPELGRAMRVVADGDGPVLVHCAAGKDRTGIVIALILEVLGVERDVIVADYALTSAFRPNRVAAYADVLSEAGIEPAAVSALFDAPADAMRLLLEGLDAEFGSVRAFLRQEGGADDQLFGALEEVLLEPAS
jgi:protein-tyrosine phosphatase